MNKIKKFLLYTLFVYALFGFLILPFIVKAQLPKIIKTNTYATISVDSVYINPFLFKAKISGINLSDREKKPLLSLKSVFIDVDFYSLIYGAFNLAKLEISEPHIYIVNNADKTINLLNIVKPLKKTEEPKKETNTTAPRIMIGSLKIDDAQIHYSDYTRKDVFNFTFDRIDIELNYIDTYDFNSSDGAFGFYSNLGDGAFLRLNTQIDGFKPFGIHGHIDFKANQLYTEWKYIQEMVNFEVADGTASVNADFSFNADKLEATKVSNINVAVKNLRIKPKDKTENIIKLGSFSIGDSEVFPMQQDLHIGVISLNGLDFNVNRTKSGEIDLQNYFSVAQSSEQNQTQSDTKEWKVVIDKVALAKMGVKFTDYAVDKNVVSRVSDLKVEAKDIELNSAKPFPYTVAAKLNAGTECSLSGRVIQKPLDVGSHIVCKGFDVTHYNPYIDQAAKDALRKYDIDLESLFTSIDLHLFVADKNGTIDLSLENSQLALNDLKIKKKSTKEKLVQFESLVVDGIDFDLLDNEMGIEKIGLDKLYSSIKRYRNGKINVDGLVIPKSSHKNSKKETNNSNFHLNVKEFSLAGAQVDFRDMMLQKKAKQTLSGINVNVYNIDSAKRTWLNYKASMRINKRGRFYAGGKVRHTPLRQNGTFHLKNLNIADINPYLNESVFVKVTDGKLALSGRTNYAKSTTKPDLRVKGKLSINSFFVENSLEESTLFSLNKLAVKDFTYELALDRLYIDEVDVDSFYVDAFVDENKTLNFAKLLKKKESGKSQETAKTKEKEVSEPLDVKIVKVNVSNGSAEFADFSIPIKFQTHIHDLNGEIYVLSSKPGETSYINLLGEVDKYGATTLTGSIDASSPKLYTDLDFNFKNLELNSLSGYSATFAGYKIDSGKLYLDLGYEIINSELKGSNSVMIDKIILGDEIEDDNVTHLPLGFVIGLLEDNEGIIDLDLPVEGNVDAPDFKYGTVIWKVFSNLVTKAVTAPFALLGSMMGIDGEELSFIEFEDGKSVITPSQREKLDNIAKMMIKRPKIDLAISATYDKNTDLFALKREKLIAMVVEKSGIKNIDERKNVLTIDLLEDIYEDLRDDDAYEKLEEKLEQEYEDEELERVYQKELLALDIEIQQVTQQELEALGKNRQKTIENYLVHEKHIEQQRMQKTELKVLHESSESIVKNSLDIKVND